jgi:hypothetical protein
MIWTSTYRGAYQLVLNGHMTVHASKDRDEVTEIKRAIDYAIGLGTYRLRAGIS